MLVTVNGVATPIWFGDTFVITPPATSTLTLSSTVNVATLVAEVAGPAPIVYVRVAELEMVVPDGVPAAQPN